MLFGFCRHVCKELNKAERRYRQAEDALGHRHRARDEAEVRAYAAYAQEWRERYEVQMHICEVEHMTKPLPIMPLSSAQAHEMEGELPF